MPSDHKDQEGQEVISCGGMRQVEDQIASSNINYKTEVQENTEGFKYFKSNCMYNKRKYIS